MLVVLRLIVSHVIGEDQSAVVANPAAGCALGQRATPEHGGDAIVRRWSEIVPFVEEPPKILKSAPFGMKCFGSPQVPFAHQRGGVARCTEPIGDRLLCKRQSEPRVEVSLPRGIEFVAEGTLVSARKQRCSRRAAKGSCDVTGGTTNSRGGEGIDMRRGNLAIPLHARLAVAQIIGNEQHDVRPRFPGGERHGCEREQHGSQKHSHGKFLTAGSGYGNGVWRPK